MNKKGFTMVELLATIVIIGILSSVGVVSVINIRKNQAVKFNQTQNKMFVETAKSYFKDNKQYLPREPLSSEYITLAELTEAKYITEDFVDYNGNKYNSDSKVRVVRIGNGIYGFSGSLIDYEGNITTTKRATITPTIEYHKKVDNNYVQLVKNPSNNNYYSNKEPRVKFSLSSDLNLGAYIYYVYRNGNLMTTSEVNYITLSKSQTVSVSIKDDDYGDATYSVKLVVYDENGYQSTIKSDIVVLDRVPPTKPVLQNPYENKWINLSYSIKGTSTDKLSGIEKWQYTYTPSSGYTDYSNSSSSSFTTTQFSEERSQNVYIRACDYAGNCSESTTSMIKIDKTEPEITKLTNPTSISGSLTNVNWTNQNFSLTGEAKDTGGGVTGGSGIGYWYWGWPNGNENPKTTEYTRYDTENVGAAYNSYGKTTYTTSPFSAERNNKKVIIRVCDVAGNCTDANSTSVKKSKLTNIKIDKTAPRCKTSGGSATWINATSSTTNRTIKAECFDDQSSVANSGCITATKTISKKYESDINTTKAGAVDVNKGGTVYDIAGNSKNCEADQTVKIDKTYPTKPTLENPKDNSWANATYMSTTSYTIKASTVETGSGVDYWQYTYNNGSTTTGSDSSKNWITYANSASQIFTTTPFSAERNQNVYIRVCDKAGNCSSKNSSMIKIDKTGPTCESSGGSTAWTKNNITLKGKCSDNLSGCKKASVSGRTYDDNGNVTWLINWDGSWDNLSPGTVYDNAGNSTACPSNQSGRRDTVAPSCGSWEGESTSWRKGGTTIKVGCTDATSQCEYSKYDVKSYSSGTVSTESVSVTIKDKSGLTATCSKTANVYIDNDPPPAPSLDNPFENEWINDSYSITGTLTWPSTGSGVGYWQYTYNSGATTTTENNTTGWATYAGSAKVPFTTTEFSAERNQYVYVRVCDAVGNCSSASRSMIKIDKTAPTCTKIAKLKNSKGSNYDGKLTTENVYTASSCSDSASGCDGDPTVTTRGATTHVDDESRSSWTVKASGTSKVWWTVYDNAGNWKECGKITVKKDKETTDNVECTSSSYYVFKEAKDCPSSRQVSSKLCNKSSYSNTNTNTCCKMITTTCK